MATRSFWGTLLTWDGSCQFLSESRFWWECQYLESCYASHGENAETCSSCWERERPGRGCVENPDARVGWHSAPQLSPREIPHGKGMIIGTWGARVSPKVSHNGMLAPLSTCDPRPIAFPLWTQVCLSIKTIIIVAITITMIADLIVIIDCTYLLLACIILFKHPNNNSAR